MSANLTQRAANSQGSATDKALVVDGHRARESAEPGARKVVDVAVGVLIREDGAFLLTSRPEGKPYAGYWEFAGGKLEAGESVGEALARELHEELSLTVVPADVEPWQVQMIDYPHALVRLHLCKVRRWSGTIVPREQQQMSWEQLPVQVRPVLPGTLPVLDGLAEERGHVGATHLV